MSQSNIPAQEARDTTFLSHPRKETSNWLQFERNFDIITEPEHPVAAQGLMSLPRLSRVISTILNVNKISCVCKQHNSKMRK